MDHRGIEKSKTQNLFCGSYIFLITAVLVSNHPAHAEWSLGYDEEMDIYVARSSQKIPIKRYSEDRNFRPIATYMSLGFTCFPDKPVEGIMLVLEEDIKISEHLPTWGRLGYKVYNRPDRMGKPIKEIKTSVATDKELVFFGSDFTEYLLQYLKSVHDERKHVLWLKFSLRGGDVVYANNISLVKSKSSIYEAMKMCRQKM